MLDLGEYRIDLDRHTVRVRGEERRLTPAEGKLLRYLADRAGETVSKEELLQQVWGYAAQTRSRTVQVTVQRLRAKIEDDPKEPRYLLNVYGVGYRLQVPQRPAPSGLVGRARELEVLLAATGAIALVGPGGVGKSRLARAAAEEAGARFVRVSLWNAGTEGEVLIRLAGAIGHRGGAGTTDALRATLVEASPARVILDEAEGAPEAAVRLAEALAEASRTVILTSRVALPLRTLPVGPLEPDAAVELFLRRIEAPLGHRPEPEAVRELTDALDRLPLALELAAARAALVPVDRLADHLEWLRLGEGRHGSLEACIAASWDALSAPDQRVLGLCAAFEAGFDLALVEAAAGAGALDALVRLKAGVAGASGGSRAATASRHDPVVRPAARTDRCDGARGRSAARRGGGPRDRQRTGAGGGGPTPRSGGGPRRSVQQGASADGARP